MLNSPSVLMLDALEKNKSSEQFPAYVEHLLARGIRRDHQIIAIGGGIIQDITCFLAATILRGVQWIFLPTTLLAQANSCIGSKSHQLREHEEYSRYIHTTAYCVDRRRFPEYASRT